MTAASLFVPLRRAFFAVSQALRLTGAPIRGLLLFTVQGCAAPTQRPDEWIHLLPCGQPVEASCEKRQSSYSALPSTTTSVVEGREQLSEQASRLRNDHRAWQQADAALAEQVASGAFGDSLETRWRAEGELAWYLLGTGEDRGAGVDLLSLIVRQGRHSYFFGAYRRLFAAARECPTRAALETFAILPEELFWDYGRARGQAKALQARGLFELGHYQAAKAALQDPSVVETFPAFAAECRETIAALPGAVLEEGKRREVPRWEGESFWKGRAERRGVRE